MPVIGVDQATGRLTLDGEVLQPGDPRMYGEVGQYLEDAQSGIARTQGYDPRYYEAYQADTGDGGTETRYRIRPEVRAELGSRVQLPQPGVVGRNPDGSVMEGQGYQEALVPRNPNGSYDLSGFSYDPRFGIVADSSARISGGDPDKERQDRMRMAALMAAFGGIAGVHAAGAGAGAGAGATNAGLDAFEAGSFAAGGAPEATALANSAGVASTAAPSTFDRFLESYISDSGSTATMPFGSEEIANLGIDTGAAGMARELGVYGNAFDASPSIWDTLSNFGSGLVDKLPAIANAARLFGDPGMPTQARASGGGSGGGGFAGGSGGGFGRGDGSAFDPMKLKQVLTLAEYLGGRR